MTKKQKEQAVSDTVKTQLAKMSLDVASLSSKAKKLDEENVVLKQMNVELAGVIENDLKADLILKIQAGSKYDREELSALNVEQLKNIEETLLKTAAFEDASFKSIRAGSAAFDHTARLTVGSLYKKDEK